MEEDNLLDISFTKSHALSEQVRAEVTSVLYSLIATYIDAKGQILEAHWNSEGANFIAVHKLFDDALDLIDGFVDPLGERIRSFGAFSRANLKYAINNTLLCDYGTITHDINNNLLVVVGILKCISEWLYKSIDKLDSIDKTTSNILQDQCNQIDKYIYLIQSNM